MSKKFNHYTGNLDRAQSARKSQKNYSERKPRRKRFLDGSLLDMAKKEEHYNLSKIEQIGTEPLSQPQKIARAKRKKEAREEARGAVVHAHSTSIMVSLVIILLTLPGVGAVSATNVLQLLTMLTATAASSRNRARSSDSTPEYSVDTLTAYCATGAKWTLTQPNSGTEYIVAGVTTLYGFKNKYPRIYVSEVSGSTNSSNLLGINAQTGRTAVIATRQPGDEFHDGWLAATSIVTANPSPPGEETLGVLAVGTAQQNSGFLDSQVCNNITEDPLSESDSYASTYDMKVVDQPYPAVVHRTLTEVASYIVLAPQGIPKKGEIDVTPHKTSLSICSNATGASPSDFAATGMIKTTSTATKKDLCTIYTMGDGAAPINTQLAVYDDSSMPKQIRMPEDSRALFVNAGEVNDYLSIRSLQGTQDLLLAGRDLNGAERILAIQDFDQIEGEVDCTELVAQPTGWQEIRIQGQRKGVFNFFDRRTALLAATPLVGGRPNLFLSTIDNPTAPLWKINLDLFSGRIVLGENYTITMPIQVPTFYNTTEAVTVHQTISLSQSSGSGEQILVVGQTYVYDGGTPVDAPVLDTLTAFNATTGKPLFVITGGIDTWGMGMNHQMTAYDALLVAQMNGQAGIITLNLPSLQTGSTQAYFTPGVQQDYTLQCSLFPSPSPSPTPVPTPTPTPKWSPPPSPAEKQTSHTGLWLVLGILAGGSVIFTLAFFCLSRHRGSQEQLPLLPENDSPQPQPVLPASPVSRHDPGFFSSVVAPAPAASIPQVAASLNQQRYDELCAQLVELRRKLEPYAQQSDIRPILVEIERLLSAKINEEYQCVLLENIMDEPAYIDLDSEKHFRLAERAALERCWNENGSGVSGKKLSYADTAPRIETNIHMKRAINDWLDNLGKDVVELQKEFGKILSSLPESNPQSFSMGMRRGSC